MDAAEEELLALESIFYDSFASIDHHRFRVRIEPSPSSSEPPHPSSLLPFFIDVTLPPSYPDDIPLFDLSNINNSSYSDLAKKAILRGLQEQASSLIGESMCYSIFEWLKDKLPEFHSMNPNAAVEVEGFDTAQSDSKDLNLGKKDTKEKMSKAQKRRYYDKFGAAAEKPRGWDWVPIISHEHRYSVNIVPSAAHFLVSIEPKK